MIEQQHAFLVARAQPLGMAGFGMEIVGLDQLYAMLGHEGFRAGAYQQDVFAMFHHRACSQYRIAHMADVGDGACIQRGARELNIIALR